jgi:sugar diacid utilization regulator
VASLRQLVESPALSPLVGYLTRPRSDPVVERLALIEDLTELERVGEHAVVLLTKRASAEAGTYRFDVALRLARSRKVAALVLTGEDVGSMTPTSAAVANRSGTAVLGAAKDVDLAELAVALSRELGGEADVALLRAHTALRAIAAHPADAGTRRLVERAGAALGVPLRMVDQRPPGEPSAPVTVDGNVEGFVAAAVQDGHLALGLDIVLQAAAAEAAVGIAAARRAEELPIQSRGEVLTELLLAPPQARAGLAQRARTLGMPIDAWHVAVRLELEELTAARAGDEHEAFQERQRLAADMLQAAQGAGGTWHSARAGSTPILVRTYEDDPGAGAPNEVARTMDDVLAALRPRLAAAPVRCGVGSAHAGADGLLASAAEARAAATRARTLGTAIKAVAFDAAGLRRALVDWYASDSARDAVSTVLAPLTELGGVRAERLIQTLHVYLDHQGSLTRTAEVLSLHRNAVAYRMNQVFSLLEDVDPDDPDDLLLLQLACRARELA